VSKDQEIDFSTTAGSNTDITGVDVNEGCAPSGLNNAVRAIMKTRASAITRHVVKAAGTYTAGKTDNNQLWRCTGAVTINLTAAATVLDGWCLWVRANGGDVTINRAGSDTINGATSATVTDGNSILIVSTGAGNTYFSLMGGAGGTGAVSTTGIQTLTNKTLTTPTIILAQSATPAPTAEGDIQWDTDDNAIVVGDGASQKVFRANDWEKISTQAFSAQAQVDITGMSAYRQIRISYWILPATDGAFIYLRASTDSGSSCLAGAAEYNNFNTLNSGAAVAASTTSTVGIFLDGGNGVDNAATGAAGTISLYEFNQSKVMVFQGQVMTRNAAAAGSSSRIPWLRSATPQLPTA
jgi:hypothetical protein